MELNIFIFNLICIEEARRPGSHQRHNGIKKRLVFFRMSLCLCHYVRTMSLCCVVHTGDIKHQLLELLFSFA